MREGNTIGIFLEHRFIKKESGSVPFWYIPAFSNCAFLIRLRQPTYIHKLPRTGSRTHFELSVKLIVL